MQTDPFSHMSRRPHTIAGFQVMRVGIVIALVMAGWLALSLSLEEGTSQPAAVAAADRRDNVGEPQLLDGADGNPRLEIADATPTAPHRADESPTVSGSPVQDAAPANASAELSENANAASPGGARAPETEQASAVPLTAPDVTGAVNAASIANEQAPAEGLVDLNTASFEELNALRGAGPLGRAIIKGRPYASVEDLVKRKVLRRAVYEKIKDQVTVR